jgi:hypothetical protein
MALGRFTFRFTERADETVGYSVAPEHEAVLRRFLVEAETLEAALLRVGSFGARYSLSWRRGGALEISGEEPDADSRAVILYRLRPFLLKDEPISFGRVRSIIARSSPTPFLQTYLKQCKRRFRGDLIAETIRIEIGGLVVTSEAALREWLNTFEYHRDGDKAVALIRAHDPLPVDSSRPIFVMLLREKADAVLHLGHVVHKILKGDASE